MLLSHAIEKGYVLNMYLDDCTEEFKHRILQKVKRKHPSFDFLLVETNQEGRSALVHSGKVFQSLIKMNEPK